jgi:superfamily II DNA/RNA helicase
LSFRTFGFDERILQGIEAMNFLAPTPVQERVIPVILEGRDLIASAQTGTGKTGAFLLPVLHKIVTGQPGDYIKCLIVVPTRELAIQISQQIEGFSYFVDVSSLAVFGGSDGAVFSNEKNALTRGADIVVCTPGRLISHLNLGYVNLDQLKVLVLDEADRMLDMGFYGDIMKIRTFLGSSCQSLLFSATMPFNMRKLAKNILKNPVEVNIEVSKPPDGISQEIIITESHEKIDRIVSLVSSDEQLKSVLVFCETKLQVKELAKALKKRIRSVEEIHSDLNQNERESVLNKFRSKQTLVLVATGILSRGIDVEDIDLVINFAVPRDAEEYIHRIGRTARANTKGRACTLVLPRDRYKFAAIAKELNLEFPDLDNFKKSDESLDRGRAPKPANHSKNGGRKKYARSWKKKDLPSSGKAP